MQGPCVQCLGPRSVARGATLTRLELPERPSSSPSVKQRSRSIPATGGAPGPCPVVREEPAGGGGGCPGGGGFGGGGGGGGLLRGRGGRRRIDRSRRQLSRLQRRGR